ncbi:MAG: metallophosphoesterase family protein [Slackia piriformis]|uniref:Phosphoesterase n=1 Tax=Slackia piriformis TaxID=626934 RepID=A0A943UVS7_9ACTN|nr:metallophosphoesterase family protein [Slackia piriformis]
MSEHAADASLHADAPCREGASRAVVGILSDTHGVLPQAAFAELADCDHIVHAGDICDPSILAQLETLAPVIAVLGNNDYPEYGARVGRFATVSIAGVRFLAAHTPDDLMRALRGATSALQPGDPLPQVAVHGHTHVPRIVAGKAAAPAAMIVCPGSVTRPRGGSRPSVAKLIVADGAVKSAELVETAVSPDGGPRHLEGALRVASVVLHGARASAERLLERFRRRGHAVRNECCPVVLKRRASLRRSFREARVFGERTIAPSACRLARVAGGAAREERNP